LLDPYLLRRALLRPYAAVARRLIRVEDPILARLLELYSYRPSLLLLGLRMKLDPLLLESAPDVRVALDVGSYDGHWARSVHDRYGATVYSFEPDPAALEQVRAHLAGSARAHVMPFGLAARDAVVALAQAGPGSTTCLDGLERADPTTPAPATVDVELRDVKRVFDELSLDHVDFVSMNIEGGEYDVLERLVETGYVARCRTLQVQFHEWVPGAHPRRRRLHRALRRTHRLEWSYPFIWERWSLREG
jgi:FkbM family methyltransferase